METNYKQLIAECDKSDPKHILDGLKIILQTNLKMRKDLISEGTCLDELFFLNEIIKKQKRTQKYLREYYGL
jgi:hypothetical protein